MKNSKIGLIGLLVAGIVAAFFVFNLNETAETGKKIDQEEARENIGEIERVEEKLNTSDELKVGLQVTMAQVSPDGSSVFGGIGPPGKTVILFNGDIIIAEKGSMIGFAGKRVIEKTINEQLPEDFQTAEYLLEHGMIDIVVHRKELRETLSKVLSFLKK